MHAFLRIVTLVVVLAMPVPGRTEGPSNCVDNCLQAGGNIFSCAAQGSCPIAIDSGPQQHEAGHAFPAQSCALITGAGCSPPGLSTGRGLRKVWPTTGLHAAVG